MPFCKHPLFRSMSAFIMCLAVVMNVQLLRFYEIGLKIVDWPELTGLCIYARVRCR